MSKKTPNNFAHLAIAGIGLFAAGAAYANGARNKEKLSRAELDDPAFAEEVMGVIAEILDHWRPQHFESEDDYTNDLFEFLAESTEFEIEMFPSTRFGKPDILIEGTMVLELKVNPNKAERDRLIGQCAGYSREWATWAIVIDSPRSSIDELERLLEDKGLDQIAVWSYC